MNKPGIDSRAILDALSEPTLIATPTGTVETANAAARAHCGASVPGLDLIAAAGDASDRVRTYLRRCSGSTGVLVGAIALPDADGGVGTHRCYGNAIEAGGRRLVLLRCPRDVADQFSLLTRRVEALNAEILRHQRTQAMLREALHERDLLVREVHHRVKNNIQVLHGLLAGAAREAKTDEARSSLADAGRRLAAMGAVQQTLHRTDRPIGYCDAEEFLTTLVGQLRPTWPDDAEIAFATSGGALANEVCSPLALIINELMTNAVKHGTVTGDRLIEVGLRAVPDQAELTVADGGPGFELGETGMRASGLGLVRGLARQLGGRFEVRTERGATCTLAFPNGHPE